MQCALGADGEHAVAVEDRARSRTVVVAVPILELGAEAKPPVPGARLRVQALDDLFSAETMDENEMRARNRRRRVAGPPGHLPHQRRR